MIPCKVNFILWMCLFIAWIAVEVHATRIRHRSSLDKIKMKTGGAAVRTKVLVQRPSTSETSTTAVGLNSNGAANDVNNLIYSPWSEWSHCSRKCKQERSRQCNAPWRCGNVVYKEERSCTGRRCRRQPFTVVDGGQRELPFSTFKNMYSSWSDWSPCTRQCRTRRYRNCEEELFCGTSVIQEDAFCYVKGTVCERMFRRLKKDNINPPTTEQKEQPPKETQQRSITDEECGVSNVSSDLALRIIGGRPAIKGRWPWQAAVLNRAKEPFCGGTLIAQQWVMTAAHCVRKRLHVRLGEHDLNTMDDSEQEYRVVGVFIHPDYDPETVDNDIALLKLSSPAIMDRNVQVACLPKQAAPLPRDKSCTILGWGKERHSANFGTDVLHEAKVPIVDIENCIDMYKDYYITGNMFCAGFPRGRVDSCAGDSGGPLLCETNNRWHVYGITSFGEGCGRKGKYGIYAKVPNFIAWMKATIDDNSDIL